MPEALKFPGSSCGDVGWLNLAAAKDGKKLSKGPTDRSVRNAQGLIEAHQTNSAQREFSPWADV